MDKMINKNWFFVDILAGCLFVLLLVSGNIFDSSTYFGTLFFLIVGNLFIVSKRLSGNLLFFKAIYWVAINIFKPKLNYNHIIWGVFLIFVGMIIFISEPLGTSEKEFFNHIEGTAEFWIGIVLVLIFNIIVGWYTATNRKKQGKPSRSG